MLLSNLEIVELGHLTLNLIIKFLAGLRKWIFHGYGWYWRRKLVPWPWWSNPWWTRLRKFLPQNYAQDRDDDNDGIDEDNDDNDKNDPHPSNACFSMTFFTLGFPYCHWKADWPISQQSITPRECIRVLVHHITHPTQSRILEYQIWVEGGLIINKPGPPDT